MKSDPETRMEIDREAFAAWGALALAVSMLGGGILWYRFGETIYVDRLLTAFANCF